VLAAIKFCLFCYNAGLLLKSFTAKLGENLKFQDVCYNSILALCNLLFAIDKTVC